MLIQYVFVYVYADKSTKDETGSVRRLGMCMLGTVCGVYKSIHGILKWSHMHVAQQ